MQLGLTGNIATGKSTVYALLMEREDTVGFDADAVVHALYDTAEVQEELMARLGPQILQADGTVCRGQIREAFLRDQTVRPFLEDVFHPRVHTQYSQLLGALPADKVLVADIPLLYEKETPYEFDAVVTVACSADLQLSRLMSRSALDKATALKMIKKQVALSYKILQADHVIWNNGGVDQLRNQLDLLVHHIFF